jgi:hypothetical protein
MVVFGIFPFFRLHLCKKKTRKEKDKATLLLELVQRAGI